MSYLCLFIVAFLFSFGGTCVNLSKPFISPEYITFLRFAVGVLLLLGLAFLLKKKPQFTFNSKWILIGGCAKALAYFAENYALAMGTSYGNIITWPIQTVLTAFLAVGILHETMSRKKAFCMALCVLGVTLISWDGVSIKEYFSQNALITVLFVVTSIGAVIHVWAQKMLLGKMDIIDMNLSMFTVGAVISMIPLPISGEIYGVPDLGGWFSIFLFGFITGIGFWLNTKGMEKVPLYVVPVIQSTTILFTLVWGVVFFKESLSAVTILGTLIFLFGILFMGDHKKKQLQKT